MNKKYTLAPFALVPHFTILKIMFKFQIVYLIQNFDLIPRLFQPILHLNCQIFPQICAPKLATLLNVVLFYLWFFFFFFINLFVLFFFCFQQAEAEELDIDLSDPELHKAATKIQASFRGHKVRKDGEPSGQWSSRVDSQFSEQFNHSNKKRNNNNNNNNNNYNNTHSFTSAPQLYNLSINKIIPTTQQQIPYISIPLLSDKSHTFSISISFPCILRNDWLHKY